MDLEGEIFEFQELEAPNKGEKVNKTICFKRSGGLYQRQKGSDGDCTVTVRTFLTVCPKSWIWYLPHTPSQGGKDAYLPSWALDAGSTLGGGVGDLRPEMMKNA